MRYLVLFLALALFAAPAAFADHHTDYEKRLEQLEKKIHHLYEMVRAYHSDKGQHDGHAHKGHPEKEPHFGHVHDGHGGKGHGPTGDCDKGRCDKSKCDKSKCDKGSCCGTCGGGAKKCASKCDKGGCCGQCGGAKECASKCDKGGCDKSRCDKGQCDQGRRRDVAVVTAPVRERFVARLEELVQAQPILREADVITSVDMTPVRATVLQATAEPSVAEKIRRYEEMIRDAETDTAVAYFTERIEILRERKAK